MNTTYIIANWKEYPETIKEAEKIAKQLTNKNALKLIPKKGIATVVCPPYPFLYSVGKILKSGKYILGAQNLSTMLIGPFTGEVSPKALVSVGVKYVIVGHSERRNPPVGTGESNEVILQKIKSALAVGIHPILCVGEKGRLDSEKSHAEVREQIMILESLSKKDITNIIIAYEPLWAIGAKVSATPEDALEMRIYIQKVISDLFDEKTMTSVNILYGGSVTAKNAKDFVEIASMNGILVGRASLDPKSFLGILESFQVNPVQEKLKKS